LTRSSPKEAKPLQFSHRADHDEMSGVRLISCLSLLLKQSRVHKEDRDAYMEVPDYFAEVVALGSKCLLCVWCNVEPYASDIRVRCSRGSTLDGKELVVARNP
jgi:hypothetical protein